MATVAALGLCLGCTGTIEDLGRDGRSPAGPGAGGSVSGPGPSVDEIDDERRAENPDLFATSQKYFPGLERAAAKRRIFRLTRAQLDVTVRSLLPAHAHASAVAVLPADPRVTNYEYSENLGFNEANFTPYTQWVARTVESVRGKPESVIDCAARGNAPECLDSEARRFVRRAFRGVVGDAELSRYAAFFTSSVAAVGLPAAVADLVDVTLTAPGYLFRSELTTDSAGRLAAAELLQNITYTLADGPPEAVGLSSVDAPERLRSPDDVGPVVDQVLATPEARKKLLAFFSAWLEVREPDEFEISAAVFPEFTPAVAAAVVAETRAFLERQLAGAAPTLKAVTETTEGFVSRATAFLYGPNTPSADALLNLDPSQRIGIFTQPAVIASHSGPTTTRLVKRGVFFTRKVMCLPLGNPPPGIDTTVPTTPGATERQKIEAMTNQPRCVGCHSFINPFGFMQENYDAIGRFRTLDEGIAVDPRVSMDFLDEGKLSAASAVDAFRGLTRSLRFQQCFARQLFRYYTGRNEAAGDDPLLRQMFFDFAQGGEQDIVRMLRTLATSAEFANRTEAP